MQPIYFSKAGKLQLNKYVNGIPVRSAETSYFRNGAVQSIAPNITINGSPISDGNSLWPAANPDTSIEGTLAVQLSFMPTELYAFIMGDTSEELTDVPFPVVDEEIVVPSVADETTSKYTVKLKHTPIDGTLILVDKDAKPWTEAETTAETGKYVLTTDTLEFAKADADKALYVSYDYQAATATRFGLPKTPARPAYELVVSTEATGEDDTLYEAAVVVDRCKVLGSINPPAQGGTPNPVTITFTVLKPRGNNRAIDYTTTPIV